MMAAIEFLWAYGFDGLFVVGGGLLFALGLFGRLGAMLFPSIATIPAWTFVVARWSGLAIVLYFGGSIWLTAHDAALKTHWVDVQAAAVAKAQVEERQKADEALKALETASQARLAAATATRQVIAHAPASTACVASPAVNAVLDSLRTR
jgi:hypothetical protein